LFSFAPPPETNISVTKPSEKSENTGFDMFQFTSSEPTKPIPKPSQQNSKADWFDFDNKQPTQKKQ
jgi:hypothetical protein